MIVSQGVPDEMFWRTMNPPVELWIESRTQIGGYDGAQIVARAEDAIANPRDRIVDRVAQRSRDHSENSSENVPASAEFLEGMQECVRSREEISVGGEHHYAVRQSGASFGWNTRLKCLALQRSKAEGVARAVVLEHEFHGPVAEAAMAVIEKYLGF